MDLVKLYEMNAKVHVSFLNNLKHMLDELSRPQLARSGILA